ncbi:MAG: DUF4175 domain-containing protein, partial [Saprospiraceae bacterium]
MSTKNSNYDQLVTKLDGFIRKYYINRLIKGSLYTVAIVLGLFLLFNVLEYYFYFSTSVRKIFLFSFVGSTLIGAGYWIVDPLVRYFKLGDTISHEDAAMIIGNHFGDVKDKLLNILQLKKQETYNSNIALLEASIDQKTEAISLVPFRSAIDLNKNRQYLKYALPPFLLLIFLLFAAPSIIKEGTNRILNNDKKFAKAAPFAYLLDEDDLKVVQYQDHTIKVNVEGAVMPDQVYVTIDNFQYLMQKEDKSTFTYVFRNVQKNVDFTLNAGSVASIPYTLEVLEKPNLTDFTIELNYPTYIGRKNEVIQNIGDIVVPEGTKMTWMFDALQTDDISFYFGDKTVATPAERRENTKFRYSKKALTDEMYKLFLS